MKKYKVKHYRSRIYNPIRGKIIKGVLIAVIAAALFGIGWFAYEPLMQAVNEKNKEIIENDPIPEKPQEPAFEPLPEEFLEKETIAVSVPEEMLYNAIDYYEFLTALEDDITAIVIDMKTRSGTVTYVSDYVSVADAKASHEDAFDLESRVKTARKLGFDVIARIFAFEDSTAPYNANEMAIRYESEDGVLWLDDSVDNGGKPWLNPYSDTAQKYILDIVYDAIECKVDAVLLDGVRFPENEGMDYAYFGAGTEDVSYGDILREFTERVYSKAVMTDTDIVLGFESYEAITGSDIYGGDPFLLPADGYAPFIDLDDFIGERMGDDFYYREMPEDPTELFTKVYNSLGEIAALDIMPVLDFEGFIRSNTRGIESFLKEEGVAGYVIIYNADYFANVIPEPEIPEEPEQPQTPVAPQQPQAPVVPQQPQAPQQPQVPTQPEVPEEPEEEEDDEESDSVFAEDGSIIIDMSKENG